MARHRFQMALDLKNAYEQICIVPEHVSCSTVTTPDGNMVSQVVQMGDHNTPAMYQALMNHIFSAYISQFMDVYLDDIIIYSDTLEEHIWHVKSVLDILIKERLYLSGSKLRFIAPQLKLLGHIIDDEGIQMDVAKVDSVIGWKVPTNRDLLCGFIGSVGYLADNIPNVWIPMGILSSLTGNTVPFHWGYNKKWAFNEVKELVQCAQDHRHVPLDYADGAPLIWMVTDGCAMGVSGLVSQGDDWKSALIAAFFSAKLNPAQQNYAVHEIEMLAGVETMLRHVDILQGAKFKWLTDHKGLIYLLNQKNLTGWQARWLEKISSFSFEVVYIVGSENVVADALSQMYANDSPGTVCARSKYTYYNVVDDDTLDLVDRLSDLPVLAGIEGQVATWHSTCVCRAPQAADADWVEPGTVAHCSSLTGSHFVPSCGEQKEGRSADIAPEAVGIVSSSHHEGNDDASLSPDNAQSIAISDDHGPLDELQGRYHQDPVFQAILQRPSNFWNFEVVDQLIYLRESEQKVLFIPKVLIQGWST